MGWAGEIGSGINRWKGLCILRYLIVVVVIGGWYLRNL
jgi:hypothetical protein